MAVSIDRMDRRARFPRPSVANMSTDDRPRTGGAHGAAPDAEPDTEPDTEPDAEPDVDPEEGRRRVDPVTHRTDVVRRLVERGVPVRALEALLPGWEGPIAEALEQRDERSG